MRKSEVLMMLCVKLDSDYKVEQIIILPELEHGKRQSFVTDDLQLTGNFIFDIDDSVRVGDVYDPATGVFSRPENPDRRRRNR